MGPFLNAFIANLIGMAVIWGDEDDEVLKEFANTRKEITSRRRIPVLYIYAGKAALGKEAAIKYRHPQYKGRRTDIHAQPDQRVRV